VEIIVQAIEPAAVVVEGHSSSARRRCRRIFFVAGASCLLLLVGRARIQVVETEDFTFFMRTDALGSSFFMRCSRSQSPLIDRHS
jgi:hypothetical protein